MILEFLTGVFAGMCVILLTVGILVIIGKRNGWLDINVHPEVRDFAGFTEYLDLDGRLTSLEEKLAPYLDAEERKSQ